MEKERNDMVNIYLFIELLHTASAGATVDTLKALAIENCKFANVVALSKEKIVAQLDCKDAASGNTAILEKIAGVDGVVQTNIIAVVTPVKTALRSGRSRVSKGETDQSRSTRLPTPSRRAQWAQQNMTPRCSTPWPMIRQPQWSQIGASAAMAHSKQSNTKVSPPMVISKLLS